MALPLSPNTTCDIYHNPNAPPADPDVAAVRCVLKADWRGGQENGDRAQAPVGLTWTHVMLIDATVDCRENYSGALGQLGTAPDDVYVPDKNGTKFRVIFVERVGRGAAFDYKRVFLDRLAVTWPSNEL